MRELRRCFRDPIPLFSELAAFLTAAVDAHLAGDRTCADLLFRRANDQDAWLWTDSVWGKNSPYVKVTPLPAPSAVSKLPIRMPDAAGVRALHARDGFHCRYCGLPVIRPEIRKKIAKAYPDAVSWGKTNRTQHAAFQAMWAQYDPLCPTRMTEQTIWITLLCPVPPAISARCPITADTKLQFAISCTRLLIRKIVTKRGPVTIYLYTDTYGGTFDMPPLRLCRESSEPIFLDVGVTHQVENIYRRFAPNVF